MFLCEITRRLIEGLATQIPNLEKRVNHSLTKQVFGIGITQIPAANSPPASPRRSGRPS